jgi:hypothetical protein
MNEFDMSIGIHSSGIQTVAAVVVVLWNLIGDCFLGFFLKKNSEFFTMPTLSCLQYLCLHLLLL